MHKNLNVLVIEPFELVCVTVEASSSPSKVKQEVASHLSKPLSSFSLLQLSQTVKVPPDLVSIHEIEDIHLQELPTVWSLGVLFTVVDELHLVAAIRSSCFTINIYDTATNRLRAQTHALIDRLSSLSNGFGAKFYKCPAKFACGTSDQRAHTVERLLDLYADLESICGELDLSSRMLDVYPWGPNPSEVHFIVDTAGRSGDQVEALPGKNNLAVRRQQYFKLNPAKSPSSEATKAQSERAFMMGRPTETVVPPSLMDSTLCSFRHDISHIQPSTQDFSHFYDLRQAMVKTYTKEIDRRAALADVLGHILPEKPEPGVIASYINDGQLSISISNTIFLYYLQEVKNEMIGISSEPTVEVTRYYIEQCRRCLMAGFDKQCNFPAILLCEIGPYLVLYIAVFTDLPIVEQVASVALHAHSTNSASMEAGARVIAALRKASSDLNKRYPTLVLSNQQPDFPFPRAFQINHASVGFTYMSAIPHKRAYCAVLEEEKTQIFVKYAKRYCEAAHALASRMGFAPTLIAVQRVEDWWMVVMEDVGDDYTTLADFKEKGYAVEAHILEAVREALSSLHGAGYVHGDIRDVNVLVRSGTGDGRPQIFLVDWDWSGPVGQVRYPTTLNSAVIRPEGAVAGAMIEVSHDDEMTDLLAV
ncbi:hypothetical protein R3P38DRAFT_2724314 [Favolaschia claudopus]|uniref:Non-specific serine/threonine protein kinase n=1 Tax=Favolaschia claudopus TaxID=2862362 RepID=A0AAW0AHU8_9AGAR